MLPTGVMETYSRAQGKWRREGVITRGKEAGVRSSKGLASILCLCHHNARPPACQDVALENAHGRTGSGEKANT